MEVDVLHELHYQMITLGKVSADLSKEERPCHLLFLIHPEQHGAKNIPLATRSSAQTSKTFIVTSASAKGCCPRALLVPAIFACLSRLIGVWINVYCCLLRVLVALSPCNARMGSRHICEVACYIQVIDGRLLAVLVSSPYHVQASDKHTLCSIGNGLRVAEL